MAVTESEEFKLTGCELAGSRQCLSLKILVNSLSAAAAWNFLSIRWALLEKFNLNFLFCRLAYFDILFRIDNWRNLVQCQMEDFATWVPLANRISYCLHHFHRREAYRLPHRIPNQTCPNCVQRSFLLSELESKYRMLPLNTFNQEKKNDSSSVIGNWFPNSIKSFISFSYRRTTSFWALADSRQAKIKTNNKAANWRRKVE